MSTFSLWFVYWIAFQTRFHSFNYIGLLTFFLVVAFKKLTVINNRGLVNGMASCGPSSKSDVAVWHVLTAE